jgi:hypothetical protein
MGKFGETWLEMIAVQALYRFPDLRVKLDAPGASDLTID